jgi:hypothetical protein
MLNPVGDNPPPHDDPSDVPREVVRHVAGGPGQAPGLCPPGKPSKSGISLVSFLPNINLNLNLSDFLLPDKVIFELAKCLLSSFESWLELLSEFSLLFIIVISISFLEVVPTDVEEEDEPPDAEDTEAGVSGTPFTKRWAV